MATAGAVGALLGALLGAMAATVNGESGVGFALEVALGSCFIGLVISLVAGVVAFLILAIRHTK